MTKHKIAEIPTSQRRVYETYAEYRKFVKGLSAALPKHDARGRIRLTDQALFAFGKFLKLAEPYALQPMRPQLGVDKVSDRLSG